MSHKNSKSDQNREDKGTKLSRREFLTAGLGAAGFMALSVSGIKAFANYTAPDPKYTDRAKALVDKMTLEEKISQMRYDAPAIPRLDIPKYNWWNECLHGVARAGYATVFPQAIGMAATWNAPLMHEVATAISDEARAKHHKFVELGRRDIYMGLTFWSPNINIVRDPRWGRGQETYGEDPHLTGQIANAFIKGLQGDDPDFYKVIATSKHFAVYNGPEPLRHQIDVEVSDKDLWETYLPAFETTVKDAKVASIMCAYNSLRGMPCCGNNPLLDDILRNQWDFDGYVVSDCWAVADFYEEQDHNVVDSPEEAAAMAVNNGTDLNCGNTYPHLKKAVEQGMISEEQLDISLTRLFEARFRLGMFDDPSKVSYTNIPYSVVDSEEHRQLARRMARESIVLLKNDSADTADEPLLPLPKDLKSLAVIGPNIDNYWTMVGNYNGTPGVMSTPLDGIMSKVGADTQVHHAAGCPMAEGVPRLVNIESEYLVPSQGNGPGLYGEYYDNAEFEGDPALERVDQDVNFVWRDDTPITGKLADHFSVRWTGKLKAPVSGTYTLGFRGYNGYRLYLDGELIKGRDEHDSLQKSAEVELEAGQTYDLKVEYFNKGPNPIAELKWEIPNQDLLSEAKAAARKSEAVVLCLGLNADIEGEEMDIDIKGFKGGDKTLLSLPDTQVELMKEIYNLGKPVVLVLMSGSAVSIPWAQDNIPAILQAWYGGQAGGNALADVLFGDYNPAGRLPVTFYKSVDDLPEFTDYSMENRTYRYFEGEPLYPFGYGLSYSRFEYSDFAVPASPSASSPLEVAVNVTNHGDRDGDEVVQLYISHLDVEGQNPIRSLAGFKRLNLKAGQTQKVTFNLGVDDIKRVDEDGNKVSPKGRVKLAIGGKQPGFKGAADASTTDVMEKTIQFG